MVSELVDLIEESEYFAVDVAENPKNGIVISKEGKHIFFDRFVMVPEIIRGFRLERETSELYLVAIKEKGGLVDLPLGKVKDYQQANDWLQRVNRLYQVPEN